MLFISCKQWYVPSIGIGQVLTIFCLKSIGIGSVYEKWYWCITRLFIHVTAKENKGVALEFKDHRCLSSFAKIRILQIKPAGYGNV